MNVRVVTFIAAVLILCGFRYLQGRSRRQGKPFFGASLPPLDQWSWSQLLLASFLTLFAELAFIRWIAVEVRVFAYFKNLALLLCFVGFGLGCALARQPVRWTVGLKSLFGLLLVIRLPFGATAFERISQSLGSAADLQIWGASGLWNWFDFLTASVLATVLFMLLVQVFIPLGQIVGRQMNLASKTLAAYSWNLVGSLLGILMFLAVSWLMLPPWVWLGVVVLGCALLQAQAIDRKRVCILLVPLVLLLHDPTDRNHYNFWTPYQQIEYSRINDDHGDLLSGGLQVNHTGYQFIINLSDDFLSRHPGLLRGAADENPYNLPFRFVAPSPTVLVVGSGTGNDVAAALRHHSSFVDAVEIDPAILALGRREHPERPYESPQVAVHLTDARAFLKRSRQRYDLVLFGLLDSHTQVSDYSNMRIDNFVYTRESFREAMALLKPEGVLFVKFQANQPWLAVRLREMMAETLGKPPLVFYAGSSYGVAAMCFVGSLSNRVDDAIAADPRLSQFLSQHGIRLKPANIPVTTDDWPYLYQRDRRIPRAYFLLAVLVMLMAAGFYLRLPETRGQALSLFFFCMGAGFLLLETQAISRLALYFGTTWQVNGIVISFLLGAILAANLIVEHSPKLPSKYWILAALLAGILLVYWFPFVLVSGSPALTGTLMAAIFAVPVLFAGMLFSLEFRTVASPSAALGANVLGAVAGGLLENVSLMTGMRSLLLLALGLYCLAGLGLWLRSSESIPFIAENGRAAV
jgi:Spermine/spermidine synthase domain